MKFKYWISLSGFLQNTVRLKTWLPLNGDVDWLSNLTILNSLKQSADKFCIVADVNEFEAQ